MQPDKTLAAKYTSLCRGLAGVPPLPSPPPVSSPPTPIPHALPQPPAAAFSSGGCRQTIKRRKPPILAFQQEGLNEAITQNRFLFISLSILPSVLSEPGACRALEDEGGLSLPIGVQNRTQRGAAAGLRSHSEVVGPELANPRAAGPQQGRGADWAGRGPWHTGVLRPGQRERSR